MTTFEHGQKVEMADFDLANGEIWEAAKVVRPPKSCLPKPGDDWHLIEFQNKARLYVHETRLRPQG